MEKERFLDALKALRKIDKFTDKLNELGLNFFETECFESICKLERMFFTEIYSIEGYRWIEWYLYDLPELIKRDIRKDKVAKESYATNGDGSPIILNTDEDLYKFLEENYK